MLRLWDVRFGYHPPSAVLEHATCTLETGSICIMIGPNAAGKTTMIRLMLGLLAPWSGQVLLDGREVAGLSAAQRAAKVGYVPQGTHIPFAFNVHEVVEMGRHALDHDAAKVNWALQCCDLASQRHRVFAELSAGQQQRVLLARALAQVGAGVGQRGDGRVLLLDEPTSAMDLLHTHETMHILQQQAQRGLAVLVVLHDLNLAARYADRIWLLHEGHLLRDAGWAEVLRPEVLEPVYGVRLTAHPLGGEGRPLFSAELTDTLRDEAPAPQRPSAEDAR